MRLLAKCSVGKPHIDLICRHNGKTMFGYPVELTWFKDLKKARAKSNLQNSSEVAFAVYEERRQVRRFPPNQRGFRGPEKGIASPGNYGDARRIRTGSSSSGGRGYRNNNRNRRSMDRRSVDRRSLDRRSIDRRSTERRSTDRRSTEQRSVSRSRSFTGSSSRSASNSGRSQSRSVSRTSSTESLREPPHTRSKTQRTSLQKTPVSENSTTIRQANASRKHRSSAVKGNQKSSVKDTSPTVEKNASKNSHDSRRSDATRSPLSLTSHSTKRWRTPEDDVNDDHLRKEEKWPSANSKSSKLKQKSLVSSANNSSDNDHSDTSKVDGNQVTVSRNSNGKEKESLKPMPKKSNHSSNNNNRSNAVVSAPAVTNEVNESGDFSDDVINLIRDHKNALAEDYKRDCEAFTTVVRMLISKDQDLESRLMPMLKEILHERGQRCIEDLRAFISDHQANESSTNESIEKNHVD
ncbi:Periphilin-1 [Schistosoma japonicum]|nr:Periphilin-1 [Schistosoma japonicum]